jgi:hypothetical protein
MNAANIRKSLEYIDKLICNHESDSRILARDARKGYNYIKFVLTVLQEMEASIIEVEHGLDIADKNFIKACELINKEPKDSHLL